MVLAKDQNNEQDEAQLRPVTAVEEHVVDHVRVLTIQDANGNIETIRTTDEHPFFVAGLGWVEAGSLQAGQTLAEGDGSDDAMVLASTREEHPEGLTVYNFTVEGDHTYFVEDGQGGQTAIWVHNSCWDARQLRRSLTRARFRAVPGDAAAHLVPTGQFSNRRPAVVAAIVDAQNVLGRNKIKLNSFRNGFFSASSRHDGTHTNQYFLDLAQRLKDAESRGGRREIIRELRRIKSDALAGMW